MESDWISFEIEQVCTLVACIIPIISSRLGNIVYQSSIPNYTVLDNRALKQFFIGGCNLSEMSLGVEPFYEHVTHLLYRLNHRTSPEIMVICKCNKEASLSEVSAEIGDKL